MKGILPMKSRGMNFPVDLLADTSKAELEQLAHNYMNDLLYSNPDSPEQLILSDSTQVTIDISSVGFIPLYGLSNKHKILALFAPGDPLTAVALYLLDQWWAVDDILKTADPARDGAVEVETIGERIVLYVLNRVIYRAKEMSSEELPFLCHGENDHAKIFWNKGEAVGFYSVKPSGCLFSSTKSYMLPVMDSIFVRKCQRRKGFGLQMLDDFVLSFKEDCLGLRYPLTKSMYKVCEKYLGQHPKYSDLLWEVQSIGGPHQRTNISTKIQALGLDAVSKSLSFTEESLVITEVTEKDVVTETAVRQAESMECTVEIVEEVTVLRATKAWGRSNDSKRRNTGEKNTANKSEKVIRVEDTEAETARDEQVLVKEKTELHDVSELVQTEDIFSVAPEEKIDDIVDTAPTMSDKSATVLASQDLDEADVTSAPQTVEPQIQDDATQDKDSEVLVVSEEVMKVHKEVETLNKLGQGTQIEVTDEKSLKRVTQHVVSLSTHETSELHISEDVKTGIPVIKTVQRERPRLSSQRHRKLEEGIKEEPTAEDGGRILRRKTDMGTPTPKHKYKQHGQTVYEKSEEEADKKMAEENDVALTEVVEELAVAEREEHEDITSIKEDVVAVKELRGDEKQQLEDEQLTNKEETEKQKEPEVENALVKESPKEVPDTAETALTEEIGDEKVKDEKKQKGEEVETSVMRDKKEISDDESEDLPFVQKTAMRDSCKVTAKLKSTKQNERHQKQREEHKDKTEREAVAASEDKKDEKTTVKQMVEQERTADKTEEIFTKELTIVEKNPKAVEPTEDVIPLTEVNLEECREVQEDEEAEGGMETVSVLETNEKEEAADMMQEPGTVASETAPEVENDTAIVVAEVPQEKAIGSEIPKLQKATVILVDLKTTCHHLTLKEAETPDERENAAPEKEQIELIAAEQTKVVSCVVEEPTSESEMLVLEEENGGENEKSIGKSEEANAEAVEKEQESYNVDGEKSEAEEASCLETRVLRSERMSVKASYQEQREDNISEVTAEKCVDEDSEEELGARQGRISVRPKGKCRRTHKQIQKEEQKGAEESKSVEETGIAPSVEEGKAVVEDGQNVMEEQSKVILKTFTESKVDDQRKPVMGDEEVELPPIASTRALKSGGKASKAPPKNTSRKSKKQQDEKNEGRGASADKADGIEFPAERSSLRRGRRYVCRNHKQPQKKEEGPKESAEEAVVEEEEEAGAGLGSAGQPPIKGDMGKALEKDEIEAKNEELVLVKVEKGVSGEGTMTVTEDEENTAELASAADDLVQEGETDTPLHNCATKSALLAPSDEEATSSGEKQLSEEMATQLSDFQRVTVVLVDLKKTQHEVQEATEIVEEDNLVENIAAETEREKVEDAVTIQDTGEEKTQEMAQEDEFKNICDEEKAPVIETKVLKSGEKKVAATARNKTIKGDKQEEEPAVETRILRKGRRCAATVPSRKCKRARTQCETEEEGETLAEELQIDKNMAVLQDHKEKEENKDESTEESSEEEAASQKEENTEDYEQVEEAAGERSTEDELMLETRVAKKRSAAVKKKHGHSVRQCETEEEGDDRTNEMRIEETKPDVKEDNNDKLEEKDANEHVSQEEENTDQGVEIKKVEATVETVEVEQSAVSKTYANEQEETPNTDQVKVNQKAPVVETRVLRSGRKSEKPIQRSKTTKSQQKNNKQEGTDLEKSSSTDEPAVETRIQRKERKSTPATPGHTFKKVCAQHETEKEEDKIITAEVNEGEEGIEQESPEEKGEEAEEELESVARKECAVGDAEEIKDDSLTEEAAVFEMEDNSISDGEETDSDMVKVEKTKSAEKEEPTITGKSNAAEVRSHTAIAGGEALVASQSVITEKEDTAVTTRTLQSKTKTCHATPSQSSRRQKGQGVVETQQEEEENPEDEETHEVHQLAVDSPENSEINAKEQAEIDKTSSTGQKVGPSAEDNVGDQAKEIGDLLDNRLIEPPSEELTIEEMESQEKAVPESKDNTLDSSVSVADKAEEIQLPQQKSIQKRTRMDYKENDEEGGEEGGESEASKEQGDNVKPKEGKDNKKAKCSANEPNLEETSREENIGNSAMHLELEKDEEEETAGLSQDDKEDEQNMSEEEVEPIVIGERVLRGRSIPLQIITPQSKSRCCSTKVQQSEMSLSDVEKSPQSAQKRSLRKRKSMEVTPTYKSKRHSRV